MGAGIIGRVFNFNDERMIEYGSLTGGHHDQDWQDDFLSDVRDQCLVLLLV